MLGLLERPPALSPLQHRRDTGSDLLVLSLIVSPGPQKIPWPNDSTERMLNKLLLFCRSH